MKFKHLILLIGVVLCACSGPKKTNKPYNVLMIIADDMNGYGVFDQYSVAQTPYLDAFKKGAVTFRNAYCSSPVCTPSRAATLSGLHPYATGAYQNGSDPWRKSDTLKQIETLPELFKRNGYTTFGRGKVYHAKLDAEREKIQWDNKFWGGGFGPFPDKGHQVKGNFWGVQAFPDSVFPDVINMEATKDFLSRDHQDPFFAVYGLWRPHTPFTAPQRFFDRYEGADFPIPQGYKADDLDDIKGDALKLIDPFGRFPVSGADTPKQWQNLLKGYCATTSFADDCIGQVLNTLKKSKYADNTIVVFWSDNGYLCGEKNHWEKGVLWEQACLTPMAIDVPDGEMKNLEVTASVSLTDIYPTLVDLCGIEQPVQNLHGVSLVNGIKTGSFDDVRVVLTSLGEHFTSLRNNNYRFIQYPDGTEELYDHKADPHEWDNLADDPKYDDVLKEFRTHIPAQWAKELPGRRH